MNGQRMSMISLGGGRRRERGIGQRSDLEKQIGFEETRMELDYC